MVSKINNGLVAVNSLNAFQANKNSSNSQRSQVLPEAPTVDYSSLGDYHSSTSASRNSKIAEALYDASGHQKAPVHFAGLPPWEDPEVRMRQAYKSDDEKLREILGRNSLLDEGEALKTDVSRDSEAQNLFLLHKASSRIEELADYLANGNHRHSYQKILGAEFDRYVAEYNSMIEQAQFTTFELTKGSDADYLSTEQIVDNGEVRFKASGVETNANETVPGLSGTEKFYIDVTKDGQTTAVEIDLSELATSAKPVSMINMADMMNEKLKDMDFNTTFNTETLKESDGTFKNERRFTMFVGFGETINFRPMEEDKTPAVYVVGSDGHQEFSNGYLQKLEGLGADAPPTETWRRNTDSSDEDGLKFDTTQAVTTDSKGNVYVVGQTEGDLNGFNNRNTTGSDVYISKYDSSGREVWSRLLGSDDSTHVSDITVDANGNILMTGQTTDQLTTQEAGGGRDTFVTKLSATGQEQWTYQAEAASNDTGLSLSTDAAGNVFVAGFANGAIARDQNHQGASDSQVLKLNADTGAVDKAMQFGTAGADVSSAITVDDATGHIYVAGDSNGTGYLKKYDADFTEIWSHSLGPVTPNSVSGLAISDGQVYVAGSSAGDGVVHQVATDGTAGWSQTFGGSGQDTISGLTISNDAVYISGATTSSLDGTNTPDPDVPDSFVSRLNLNTGTSEWAHQFGGALETRANDLVFTSSGSSVLNKIGLAEGMNLVNVRDGVSDYVQEYDAAITTQTGLRPGSSFKMRVGEDGPERTITIEADETVRDLSYKVRDVLGVDGDVTVTRLGGGLGLSIKALNGTDIYLSKGPEGFDALQGLGLYETKIYGRDLDPTTNEPIKRKDLFALNINSTLKADTDSDAGNASIMLKYAANKFKDAYEYLLDPIGYNDDPLADLKAYERQQQQANAVANAPQYLRNQINGYKDALSRVSVINQNTSKLTI